MALTEEQKEKRKRYAAKPVTRLWMAYLALWVVKTIVGVDAPSEVRRSEKEWEKALFEIIEWDANLD